MRKKPQNPPTQTRDAGAPLLRTQTVHSPERRGVLTGQVQPAHNLIRVVRGPDGQIVPDIAHKLPGRGAWLELDRAAWGDGALVKKLPAALSRSFRQKVDKTDLPIDFPALLDRLLAQRCLDRLGLMRKAGTLTLGFEKITQAARDGRIAALVHARDAGADGVAKLARLCSGNTARVQLFSGEELSLSLGREHVVHAALHSSGGVANFLVDARRLALVRGDQAAITIIGEG